MTEPQRARRSPFAGRGVVDVIVWILGVVLAVVSVVRVVRTGTGWAPAVILVLMVVLYSLVPWLNAARARKDERRRAAREGTLTIDDWGVTRVVGELREAVAWEDLVWVRIYTTSDGPFVDDVYFALGAADGKGCLVPQDQAVRADLLAVLQARLPGLDNQQVIRAMASTDNAYFTIWTRVEPPGPPPVPPSALN
jgi:hypothetical protein